MKTKLLLLVAVLFASFSMMAQINSVAVVGAGVGGWPTGAAGEVDANQLTRTPGTDTWVIENLVVSGVGIKIRANNSWNSATAATNPGGNWGRPVTGSQFPTATADEGGGSGDINAGVIPGTYTLTFDTVTKVYTFSGGPVIPTVKIVGAAVSTAGGETMITNDGNIYTLRATLLAGGLDFDIDGVLYGSTSFPTGNAESPAASSIPATAGIWDITLNLTDGGFTFVAVDPLVNVAIVGGGTPIGWPDYADPATEDLQKMKNKDNANENYYIGELPLTVAGVKFRENKAWTNSYGGVTFPTGNNSASNDDILVTTAGTYSVEFVRSTRSYNFFTPKIGLIGDAIGGWNDASEINLDTTDGVTYTKNGVVVVANNGCKFRLDNRWDKAWGSTAFPSGTSSSTVGDNIAATMGTYNVTFNRLTGEFSFADPLAVSTFTALGFSVSPNPTQNTWSFSSSKDAITAIQVVDMLGKIVVNTTATTVDASGLTSGIYFAKVATATATSTVKVIKN